MRRWITQLRVWDLYRPAGPAFVWGPLLALAVANWLTGLTGSYEIDETGTFTLARDGPLEAFRRTAGLAGQSPLYHFIASLFLWPLEPPYREAVSRLPSMCGLAGATWMLYRTGERWVGRGAGWVAALLFASIPGVATVGMQMRPYGVLWCAATVHLWFCWKWFSGRRPADLWWSRASLTLCIACHYLAVLLAAVELLHALWRRRLSVRYCAATVLAVLVAVSPALLGVRKTLAQVSAWRYSDLFPMNPWNLGGQLPLRLTLGLALTWLAARLVWGRVSRRSVATAEWRWWLGSWAVLYPAVLWALHFWSEAFHVRYLMLAAPPAALLVADAFLRLAPGVRTVAVAIPLLLVLSMRLWFGGAGAHDFRLAAETVADLSLYEQSPLLAPSWFVEARVDDALPLYQRQPGLWGHLAAYPVANAVHPLPVWYSDPHIEPAIHGLLAGPLRGERRLLVAMTGWTPAFQRAFAAGGFQVRLHPVARDGVVAGVVAECTRP